MIFADSSLKTKIINGSYELLLANRNGTGPDQALFKSAIKMFHELRVYTSDFGPYMLAKSQQFVREWANRECEEKELPVYVNECVQLITAETGRCEEFDLDTSTRRALLALLETHLIEMKVAELSMDSYYLLRIVYLYWYKTVGLDSRSFSLNRPTCPYLRFNIIISDARTMLTNAPANQDSVADLLDEDDATAIDSLQQLYALLQRRRFGNKLRPAFAKWIDDTGTAIIFDDKEQEHMVVRLLALKQKLDNIWRFSFQKDEHLGHALRESFESFINKTKKSTGTWGTDNSKPSEMIAKYVDMLLKAGAKAIPISLTSNAASKSTPAKAAPVADAEDDNEEADGVDEDEEVNKQLDQVLDLFRFVHGKAVFEAFYKKDLARRLLMGRSASADAEKNMLARLKTGKWQYIIPFFEMLTNYLECGAGFTQNLETMFKDIELARDEMTAYKQRLANNERKLDIDLTVNILSAAAWPSYPDVPCTIPHQVKRTIDNFEAHYYSKHSGRKLAWKHALAHCQMKANFPKGSKELVVSSFQAIVLLLFNRAGLDEHLTYEHIRSESGLSIFSSPASPQP